MEIGKLVESLPIGKPVRVTMGDQSFTMTRWPTNEEGGVSIEPEEDGE